MNDLYESKNLYMVVDNLCSLGGCAQKLGFAGPALGARQASANKRQFDEETMKAGQAVIGLQYGTNKCASQKGMTAPGTGRQIRPDGESAYNLTSLNDFLLYCTRTAVKENLGNSQKTV